MTEIIVNVTLEAQPGKADELESALRAALAPSRAEEGNVSYDLHRDRKDPGKFMFYEVWKSMDAIKAHNTQPHYERMAAAVGPLLAKPPALATYERLEAS